MVGQAREEVEARARVGRMWKTWRYLGGCGRSDTAQGKDDARDTGNPPKLLSTDYALLPSHGSSSSSLG